LGQPWLSVSTRATGPLGGRLTMDAEERRWVAKRPGTARALHRTVKDVIGMSGQVRHFMDRALEAPSVPPVAVYWGDKDRVIPFSQSKVLPSYLQGARIFRFAGAGHYPHHDFPESVATDLVAFFRDDHAEPASVRRPISAYP